MKFFTHIYSRSIILNQFNFEEWDWKKNILIKKLANTIKKIKIEFDRKNPRMIQFNENKKRNIISNKININYKNKNQILKIKKNHIRWK
jgi:hypothetical protein